MCWCSVIVVAIVRCLSLRVLVLVCESRTDRQTDSDELWLHHTQSLALLWLNREHTPADRPPWRSDCIPTRLLQRAACDVSPDHTLLRWEAYPTTRRLSLLTPNKKLRYRATWKPAENCWNRRGNDNPDWNDLQMSFKVVKIDTNRKQCMISYS